MSHPPKHSLPNIRLLLNGNGVLSGISVLNGIGALSLLWVLILWSGVGYSSQSTTYHQYPAVNAADNALPHVSSEQQLVLRAKGPTFSSSPQPDQSSPLIAALFFVALAIFLLRKKSSTSCLDVSSTSHRLQLQTLNISRAPPLSL